MTIEERAARLAEDLGVDEAAIREDLANLVEYSVPVDEAEQSLRRKYRSDEPDAPAPSWLDVEDISLEAEAVSTTVRVLSAGKRSIRFDGEERVITEGEFADASGRISYTAWQDFGLSAGDSVAVENAGVREWDGKPELNLGAQTRVTPADEPVEVPFAYGDVRALADLEPGDRDVTVEVRVLEIEQRTIDGRDGETVIHSGVLGDGSGRLPFTDWEAREAVELDASLRFENAYVREFRGIPSVNLSEFSEVTAIDPVEVAPAGTRRSIAAAIAAGGLFDVELHGTVVDIREGSGLIERCPECARVLRMGQCRSHGEVDGEDDLRVKAVLDDGTAAATVILGRELTEAMYGDDLAAALAAAREAMDQAVVASRIHDRIVGRAFRARGSLSVDDYGANLEAETFEPLTEDPAERAQELLAAVGDGA